MSEATRGGGRRYPHSPLARSMADLAAPSQFEIVRALAREHALDPEAECERVMGCRTEEQSKIAAAFFIGHLRRAAGPRSRSRR